MSTFLRDDAQDDKFNQELEARGIKTNNPAEPIVADRSLNVGNQLTGPIRTQGNLAPRDFVKAERAKIAGLVASSPDPLTYAKGVSIDASHTGHNFDRYYTHDNFKKLGFSPFRDNEAIYNKNSTWAQDFGRAMKQYPTLAGVGFTSALKNWGSLASTEADVQSAWDMGKAMATASSSKAGFGASFTNFAVNSAYTVGLITEIAIEDLGVTLLSGGNVGLGLSRLPKQLTQLTKGTYNAVKAGETVSGARKIWEATMHTFNPLSNVTELYRGVDRGIEGYKALTPLAMTRKTAGAFIRDLREINLVTAEAKLEAGSVQIDVTNKLMSDYYDIYKKSPGEKDMARISSRAKEAAAKAYLGNLGGIYLSNKIVLDTALKGFKPFRKLAAGASDSFMTAIKKGAKPGDAIKVSLVDTSGIIRKYAKGDYWRAVGQSLTPTKALGSTLRYTSANLAEGLQEVYQESLAMGLTEEYTKNFFSQNRAIDADIMKTLALGAEALDKEDMGIETFMSGFAMGGALGTVQNVVFNKGNRARLAITDYFTGGTQLKDADAARKTLQKELEESMTAIINDPSKYADALAQNVAIQNNLVELNADAEARGDKLSSNKALDDSMFNHVHTLLTNNRFDFFIDALEDMQNLSDQELVEAFANNNPANAQADDYNKNLRERLDSAISKAKTIKSDFEYYTERLPNTYDKKTQFADWQSHEEAIKFAVFNKFTFTRSVDGLQKITDLLRKLKPLAKIEAGKITSLVSEELIEVELEKLKTEIDIYSQGDANQQRKAKDLQEQYDALQDLQSGLFLHNSDVAAAKKAALNPELEETMRAERKAFVKGGVVEFENADGSRTKAKVKKVRSGKVTLEYIDSKTGKKKTKSLPKEKVALVGEPLVSDEELDGEGAPQTRAAEESKAMAYKSFQAYIQALAKTNNGIVDVDQLDQAFAAILDYYDLDNDARNAAKFVNSLLDPEYFKLVNDRIKQAFKDSQEIAKTKIKEQAENFMNMKIQNAFINALQDIKVFFNPDQVDTLIDDNRVPDNFLDSETLQPIRPDDPRYQKILDLIDKLEQLTGRTATNKPITGASVQVGKFSPARDTKNDTRLIADFAKALGFDPNTGGEVDLLTLLDFVINSPHGSVVAKKLAQRLKPLVGNKKATIKMNHIRNNTYDPTNGLVIDPRYSTQEYSEGNVNFEYSIMNGIATMLISEATDNVEFNKAINNLIAEFNNALEEGRLDQAINSNQLGLTGARMPTDSIEEFVAEALTNPSFQQLLQLVSTKEKTTNLWEDFLNVIKDVLRRMLGVSNANTLLDETVALVSNKLEPTGLYFKKSAAAANASTEPTVTTPVEDMPSDLQVQLRSAYNGDEKDFEEWIRNSALAGKIIADYNAAKRAAAPQPSAGAQNGPQPLSDKELNALRAAGYTDADINAMTEEQARDLILTGTKKQAPAPPVNVPDGYRYVEENEVIDEDEYEVYTFTDGRFITNAPVSTAVEPFNFTISNGTITAKWKGSTPALDRVVRFKVEDGILVSAEETTQSNNLTPVVTPIKKVAEAYENLNNSNEWTFTEQEEVVSNTAIPIVNEDSEIMDILKGTIVYVSAGMNVQSILDKDSAAILGDDFTIDALKETGLEIFQDVNSENLYQKIIEFYNTKPSDADSLLVEAASNSAFNKMTEKANEGYTVITQSQTFLGPLFIQRLAAVITPQDTAVYFRTESDPAKVQNRRANELAARQFKIYAVASTDNVADILEGKAEVQASNLNLQKTISYENVTSIKELMDIKAELDNLSDSDLNSMGMNRLEVEKKIQEKLEELSLTPNFEDIQKGHILVTNTGEMLYVTGNYKTKLYYKKLGAKGKGMPLTKDQFDKTIIGVYSQTSDLVMPGAAVDPDAQAQAAENIKASIAELTDEAKAQVESEVTGDKESAKRKIKIC